MSSRDDLPEAVFLDPWLTAKGDALKGLSETIIEEVERKICSGLTQKARRDALARRRTVVENLTANFATLTLSPHLRDFGLLAVPTDKRKPTRYDREDYPTRLLSMVLDAMTAGGFIIRHPSVFKQRCTTAELTGDMITAYDRYGVRPGDIGRVVGAEPIWLNARTGRIDFRDHTPIKRRVVYEETQETTALRGEMNRINAYANEADFRFGGEPQAPVAMRRMFLLRSEDDHHAFNLSGRLFGAWWQGVKSTQRHLITIGGEPIADLDWSGAFLQILYVLRTGRLFQGDPYAVPGLEDHRDGAKEGLLSLLSRSGPMRRLTPELRGLLPDGWTAKRLVEGFSTYHSEVAEHFATDVGVELMAWESRLMVALLLQLETQDIAAQCLHDGIQVAVSDKARAEEAMVEVSERLLGVSLPVKEKPIRIGREAVLMAAA